MGPERPNPQRGTDRDAGREHRGVRLPLKAAGLSRQQHKIIDSGVEAIAARLGGSILDRWQATGKTGARMRYIGLVLEGHKKSPDH